MLLEYMKPGEKYKTSELAQVLGVKASRSRKILTLLVEDGEIDAVGENRQRVYIRK